MQRSPLSVQRHQSPLIRGTSDVSDNVFTDNNNDNQQQVDWNLLKSLRERHEKEKALVAEIAASEQ